MHQGLGKSFFGFSLHVNSDSQHSAATYVESLRVSEKVKANRLYFLEGYV